MINYKEPLYSQSYVDTGKGNTVILLHGLFGNITMWRPTINTLQNQYRVIVPRLPFFEDPIHRTNISNLVEALHQFIDWHQLTDVTLVGTDIGGQVALCYAQLHPERVSRIVLSGSSGLFENLPEWKSGLEGITDQVRRAFYRDELATDSVVNEVLETINTKKKSLYIKFFTESSQQTDVADFLPGLRLPVLIIWGLQDKITPPEVALQFHDLLPNANVKFIHECGHLPMVEKAKEYTYHVKNFLGDDIL